MKFFTPLSRAVTFPRRIVIVLALRTGVFSLALLGTIGATSGEGVAHTMRLVAENVESQIISDSGHWVAEEAPEQLLAVLGPFLAPYRDAAAQ